VSANQLVAKAVATTDAEVAEMFESILADGVER
jgi:hypothetical protein